MTVGPADLCPCWWWCVVSDLSLSGIAQFRCSLVMVGAGAD
ncbi:unnamed protein product [Staurois parvus]|uniref:Uncharacterized protein n=1 Tax=Staurois parvus TaxID=386267 RepID=A0ABN9EFK6_9NEOB|nr:unnamed protein product [Staurois parvus]